MLDKIREFIHEHPQVLVWVAAAGVAYAVENYAWAVGLAKNIEDLKASEALGG